MPTNTPSRRDELPPPPPEPVRARYRQLVAEARSQWRRWATAIAAGSDPPPPMKILEAAATLAITTPGETLEADATRYRREAELLADLDELRASCPRLWTDDVPEEVPQ